MQFQVGERVRAAVPLDDEGFTVAVPGDLGIVEYVRADGLPAVRFASTGRLTDCDDGEVCHAR